MKEVKGTVVGHDGRNVYIKTVTCGDTDTLVFPHVHHNPLNVVDYYKGREVTMVFGPYGWTIN